MSRFDLLSVFAKVLLAIVPAATLPAQVQPLVVSAGYAPPSVVLAPGAVTTIYVTGLNLAGQSFAAPSVPLPTSLGGISVALTSQVSSSVPAAPLFSVTGVPGSPQFTAITIEVPTEIYAGIPGGFIGTIAVSQNGLTAPSVPTLFVESNVQVIKQCAAPVTQSVVGPAFELCSVVAQHGDGSAITASAPAEPGEQVVFYAFGLGKTIPAVQDGSAATGLSPTIVPVFLDLNFAPNAPPITVPAASTSY